MEMNLTGPNILVTYAPVIEGEIAFLKSEIEKVPTLQQRYNPRWLAVQLLEGDLTYLDRVDGEERSAMQSALSGAMQRLEQTYGEDLDIAIADSRYAFVRSLVSQVLSTGVQAGPTASERIDRIVTHKLFGIPIFLGLMYLVFNLVQNVSAPYLDWVDGLITGPVTRWAGALLGLAHAPQWAVSLVLDGVIGGVGGVLVFLPGLMVMYFSLAFLEDCGYLARAAFVMDRAISALGLHGKSFIPMILGFGCNVPAIYATRMVESRPARILTGLLVPFMSCSARLPVYVVFGLAFFPRYTDWVIWAMYLLGICVAALAGIVLSRTVFKGASRGTFLLEMPPYRMPTLRGLLLHMWEHSAGFVRKAGTFILGVSIVLWFLLNLPWGVATPEDSYFGRVSSFIAPIFRPAGFGEWQASGALVTGLLAKEVVVSTMSQVLTGDAAAAETPETSSLIDDLGEIASGFGQATILAARQVVETLTPGITVFPSKPEVADTALSTALRGIFSPLAALAFIVFVLLYVPCVATIGAQFHEFGPRWALLSITLTLILPWAFSVLVYQGGRILGLG